MDPAENAVEENRRMRRAMRDLVALSTLPAAWTGLGLEAIARSLADALLSTLSLDLIDIQLAGLTNATPIEVVRTSQPAGSEHRDEALKAALVPLVKSEVGELPVVIPDPFGAGTLNVAVTRFGVGDDFGVLVTGCRRTDFPSEHDRLLLGVAANQTAVVLQQRRAEEKVREQQKWFGGTFASIDDAASATDTDVTERKRLEEVLRQSEQRFARFMQHLPGLAWIKDTQGRYAYVNDAAEKAFRTPRSDLYGKTDDEVFPPDVAARFSLNDRRALTSGSGVQVVETLEHEDGTLHYSLVTKFPIQGLAGEAAFVGGMAIDITEKRQAEEDVRHSEERFRSLMEQAPFSIQVFAPDGRTLRVNRAWEELWGVRFEQIEGYNVLQDRQLEAKGVLEYIQQGFAGQATRVPAIQYNPNDTIPDITQEADPRRWLSAVIYPLKDAEGRVREVVLIHEDITARHRAEEALRESERLYRAIGESIDYGVWVCDPQGRNTYASDSFLRLVGLTQEQCSEFGWGDVLHPDDAGRTLAAWKKCVATGEYWDMEHRFRGVDGRWHPMLARGVPVKNERGEITAWTGINLDISRLKRVEDELREADRRKDEFLATLAHELRNPLAPIRNSLQILKMPRVDAATAQQTRDMIERQVHHLVRLVDDLLDVSRVMRGKIELRREPVELAMVVARAVETVQPLIEAQEHQFEIDVAPESLLLDADPVRLAQVVGNLLTNAAKYTEANGRIWLKAERESGWAVLRVRDNGIGIAPDVLPHVFNLFMQVDHAATRSQGGLGIGLTLVKNLVDMHGGTVEACSEGLGRGCEFIVRLPLLSPRHRQSGDEGDAERRIEPIRASGHRLLVVDDNRDAAVSLAMLLELQGHEVQVAHDGPSALSIVGSYRPHVVFLDLGMPGMDGFEVARRLRQQPGLKDVVLAALTGWGQQDDRRRTAEAGFNHHLVKPPEPSVIEGLLADLKRSQGK